MTQMPIQNLSLLNLQGKHYFLTNDISKFFETLLVIQTLFRYGVTMGAKTIVNIKKDEEIFVDYDYGKIQPKWYQNLKT